MANPRPVEKFVGTCLLIFLVISASRCSGGSGGKTTGTNPSGAPSYAFVAKWGSGGSGDGQFWQPQHVAIDPTGKYVYVADTGNFRVQKFDASGTFIKKWGSEGTDDGQFKEPSGIAVDSFGYVYVADRYDRRIQKFDSGGNFVTKWGSVGFGDGQFLGPTAIATDSTRNVYVADSGAHFYYDFRIQKFSSTGSFLLKWGSGVGLGFSLWGIAVDSSGYVYVADIDNISIQKFDSDGSLLRSWGSKGFEPGQFAAGPLDVVADSAGYVYVTDGIRVNKFDSVGNFLTRWGSSVPGAGDGEFNGPRGVAVDSNGYIYVSDTNNNRVQKFRPNP